MPKKVTAAEVAEVAGVSRTTVSFVLNNVPGMRISEETRTRVIEAAHKLGYHPDATARRMVSGKTSVIGFVLRQSPDQVFADHFLPQVLSGLSQYASSEGYYTLFAPIPLDDNSDGYTRLVRERHVDGIVLSGPRSDDEELPKIHAEGAHIVLVGQLPSLDIPSIDVDNVGGAKQAIQHLLSLGHRRIAMITNAPLAYTASADRRAGYRQALEEAGLAYDANLVRMGDFTPQSGYRAMSELLALRPLPEAVFVASDTVALGAMQAIRQTDLRIPQDLALIGFDDIPLDEYVDPPLTTIHLPAFGLGWGAAEMLIRLISGEEIRTRQVYLDTELVVRDSCGANQNKS
ncbi:MAG: LacI family DNA-binding transcriptional regulator [Anaerolineales bacterium]|nr:LacI family DNA-binding transcriptional regulator [Anaerolineales bacterium]